MLIIIEPGIILNPQSPSLKASCMLTLSRILNISTSVLAEILTVGILKNVTDLSIFNSIFNPICICLQEVGNSSFLNSFSNSYPFLNHYRTVLRRADKKIPGMRGLYIGVYSSCQFTNDDFEYRYILSVNIVSFWGVRCSLGNIYIPSKKTQRL